MRSPSVPRQKLFWMLQIGGWLTLALVLFVISLLTMPPLVAVFNSIIRQVVGFVLTLGLAAIYRRWHWETFSLWRHGLAALGLSLAAMFVDLAITRLVYTPLAIGLQPQSLAAAAAGARTLIYASWSALYLALSFFFDIHERNLRLTHAELAARDAELLMLRAQLNPHFLFNALNSIVAEADDNPSGVKTITRGLSDFLRFSLRQRGHFGAFGEELAAIENYLHVERSRFEERLNWQIKVPPALRLVRVPCALLLPLVENAIKFGLQTSPAGLQLRIGAERDDHRLIAFVENSGHWVEPDPASGRSPHIGLANLRRRLELLCGAQATVVISRPPGLVRVEVGVPVEKTVP